MSGISEIRKRVEDFQDDLPDEIEDSVRTSNRSLQGEIQIQLYNNDSVVSKNLLGNIEVDERRRSELLIHTGVTAPPWSRYVEYGTGQRARQDTQPGHKQYDSADPMPPYEPILRWVAEKNLVPTNYDTQTELARAIQRTLGELGQIPRPFMRTVWFDGLRGYKKIVRDAHDGMKQSLRHF